VPSRRGPVLTGHAGPVMAVQFSPDGQWLASAGHDGFAALACPRQPPGPLLAGHRGHVLDLAYHPAGTLLATAAADSTVRLWAG
jgi:WD40 repeat protein